MNSFFNINLAKYLVSIATQLCHTVYKIDITECSSTIDVTDTFIGK